MFFSNKSICIVPARLRIVARYSCQQVGHFNVCVSACPVTLSPSLLPDYHVLQRGRQLVPRPLKSNSSSAGVGELTEDLLGTGVPSPGAFLLTVNQWVGTGGLSNYSTISGFTTLLHARESRNKWEDPVGVYPFRLPAATSLCVSRYSCQLVGHFNVCVCACPVTLSPSLLPDYQIIGTWWQVQGR